MCIIDFERAQELTDQGRQRDLAAMEALLYQMSEVGSRDSALLIALGPYDAGSCIDRHVVDTEVLPEVPSPRELGTNHVAGLAPVATASAVVHAARHCPHCTLNPSNSDVVVIAHLQIAFIRCSKQQHN